MSMADRIRDLCLSAGPAGIACSEIAAAVGLHRQGTHYHLQRLHAAGLIGHNNGTGRLFRWGPLGMPVCSGPKEPISAERRARRNVKARLTRAQARMDRLRGDMDEPIRITRPAAGAPRLRKTGPSSVWDLA